MDDQLTLASRCLRFIPALPLASPASTVLDTLRQVRVYSNNSSLQAAVDAAKITMNMTEMQALALRVWEETQAYTDNATFLAVEASVYTLPRMYMSVLSQIPHKEPSSKDLATVDLLRHRCREALDKILCYGCLSSLFYLPRPIRRLRMTPRAWAMKHFVDAWRKSLDINLTDVAKFDFEEQLRQTDMFDPTNKPARIAFGAVNAMLNNTILTIDVGYVASEGLGVEVTDDEYEEEDEDDYERDEEEYRDNE